jgi:hypothetical protein
MVGREEDVARKRNPRDARHRGSNCKMQHAKQQPLEPK